MNMPRDVSHDMNDYVAKDTDEPTWSVAVGTAVHAPVQYGNKFAETRKSADSDCDPNSRKWIANNRAFVSILCSPGVVTGFYPDGANSQMRIAMPYVGKQVLHATVHCAGWLYEKTANYRDLRVQLGNMVIYRNLCYPADNEPMTLQEHVNYRM